MFAGTAVQTLCQVIKLFLYIILEKILNLTYYFDRLLLVTYCMSLTHVTYHMSPTACHLLMSPTACHLLMSSAHVTYCMSSAHVTYCMSLTHVTYHMSPTACHLLMSPIACHLLMLHIICHLLHVICSCHFMTDSVTILQLLMKYNFSLSLLTGTRNIYYGDGEAWRIHCAHVKSTQRQLGCHGNTGHGYCT